MRKILEPELRELIERVAVKYEIPDKFLTENSWLRQFSNFKKYGSRMNELLKEREIEQVVAVANSGLWTGAMAKKFGYDVRIIDVHRDYGFKNLKRLGEIRWYCIKSEGITKDEERIRNLNDTSSIIVSDNCENYGIKMGVVEFEKVESGKRTAITDCDLEQGFSMAVANKHLIESGVDVVDKIVISNHGPVKGVRTLDGF
jgi:hypothetical protein